MRNDDHTKQVPLVFVIMSGKTKNDYEAVLQEVKSVGGLSRRVSRRRSEGLLVPLDAGAVEKGELKQIYSTVTLKSYL